MKRKLFQNLTILLVVTTTSCAPSPPATPTVDVIGTTAMQIAFGMQTQTAGAVMLTPFPPTETLTPSFTDTPSEPPTETPKPEPPYVVKFAPCFKGPGENYTLISNIDPSIRKSGKQVVTILGVGVDPGWIVIRNPYFNNPCFIRIKNMEIDPQTDLSQFPVMTPAHSR